MKKEKKRRIWVKSQIGLLGQITDGIITQIVNKCIFNFFSYFSLYLKLGNLEKGNN